MSLPINLIGIDDTDNLESRGTGHRVRQLGEWLAANGLAKPRGITRHQLLVDSRIPYTSHNSSACLAVETRDGEQVWEASREFLLREAAPGSDAGLCMAAWDEIPGDVLSFGRRAKTVVLDMQEAEQTAAVARIKLEGLTGTRGGIIGALAGLGLHRGGNDGRYLWLPGLRELSGRLTAGEICTNASVDRICTLDGTDLPPGTIVDVGEWLRPILRDGKATLYVEEHDHEWYIIPKEHIKSLSN